MENAYSQAVELNSLFWMRYSAGILGTIYVSEGQLGQAARILDAALENDDSLDTLGQRLCWVARLQLALERKMPNQAVEIAERLLSKVIQVETNPIHPWQFPPRLQMLYGEALWTAKRFTEAEIQLKAALESAETGEAHSLVWRIHRLLGQCYHSQRRYESAEVEYAAARGLLAGLAAAIPSADLRDNFIDKTSQLFPRFPAGGSLRQEKRQYGGLTRRERQIAWRLSQGLSNRRIAEDLILSERTVERHVSHILDKLGFDSRTQIISWALQTGIIKELD
jgi:DNA-binding CsgD family transcriptional regulator